MSLKPGMSWNDVKKQDLEKGVLKDAVAGAALAATLTAAGAAHHEVAASKKMMAPMSAVQMEDHSGQTMEQPDPARPLRAPSQEKFQTFRQRLAEIREKMKASAKEPQ